LSSPDWEKQSAEDNDRARTAEIFLSVAPIRFRL
jgi:hypothetical protein